MLATNFGSLRRTVTKVWFCTRLFKLWSPNLDQRCKTTWSRSLLFWGAIHLDFQGQFELKNQSSPHFKYFHSINHPPIEARTTKFGQNMQNTMVKLPVNLRIDWCPWTSPYLHFICMITLHRFERESPNLHQAWYPGILSAGIENRGHCPCKKNKKKQGVVSANG